MNCSTPLEGVKEQFDKAVEEFNKVIPDFRWASFPNPCRCGKVAPHVTVPACLGMEKTPTRESVKRQHESTPHAQGPAMVLFDEEMEV